jgi:hypothetical protein
MRRTGRIAVAWIGLALLGGAGLAHGQGAAAGAAVSRTFAAPVERTWEVTESVLKKLGWSIDERDRAIGWMVTDSRGVEFKDFGVYGEGSRHKLRLTLKAAGEGRTAVSVERELWKEERILWMTERKPLPATDQKTELGVLDELAQTLPVVAAGPAPPAAAAPTPGPPAPAGARPGGRSEFTFKVTYRVKGTAGSAKLTYRNAEGGTVQTSVRVPWESSFDTKGGSFLYVSAQNEGTSGSVTCEIVLDGESRTTSTSSGAYVIAECSNAAERN